MRDKKISQIRSFKVVPKLKKLIIEKAAQKGRSEPEQIRWVLAKWASRASIKANISEWL